MREGREVVGADGLAGRARRPLGRPPRASRRVPSSNPSPPSLLTRSVVWGSPAKPNDHSNWRRIDGLPFQKKKAQREDGHPFRSVPAAQRSVRRFPCIAFSWAWYSGGCSPFHFVGVSLIYLTISAASDERLKKRETRI